MGCSYSQAAIDAVKNSKYDEVKSNVNSIKPGSDESTKIKTILYKAVEKDNANIVKYLLGKDKLGLDCNVAELLHVSMFRRFIENSIVLINFVKNTNELMEILQSVNHAGQNLLHVAIKMQLDTVLDTILSSGINKNCIENTGAIGKTALLYAVENEDMKCVDLLIAQGADVNAQEETHGFTSLHIAVKKLNHKIIELLLDSGQCNLHLKCHTYKKTALEHAYSLRTNTNLDVHITKMEWLLGKSSDQIPMSVSSTVLEETGKLAKTMSNISDTLKNVTDSLTEQRLKQDGTVKLQAQITNNLCSISKSQNEMKDDQKKMKHEMIQLQAKHENLAHRVEELETPKRSVKFTKRSKKMIKETVPKSDEASDAERDCLRNNIERILHLGRTKEIITKMFRDGVISFEEMSELLEPQLPHIQNKRLFDFLYYYKAAKPILGSFMNALVETEQLDLHKKLSLIFCCTTSSTSDDDKILAMKKAKQEEFARAAAQMAGQREISAVKTGDIAIDMSDIN